MVCSIDDVATFSKKPKLPAPPCSMSSLTCLSMNLSVSLKFWRFLTILGDFYDDENWFLQTIRGFHRRFENLFLESLTVYGSLSLF